MKKALSAILAITMTLSAAVVSPAVRAEDDPVVTRFAVVSDIHTNPLSAAKRKHASAIRHRISGSRHHLAQGRSGSVRFHTSHSAASGANSISTACHTACPV